MIVCIFRRLSRCTDTRYTFYPKFSGRELFPLSGFWKNKVSAKFWKKLLCKGTNICKTNDALKMSYTISDKEWVSDKSKIMKKKTKGKGCKNYDDDNKFVSFTFLFTVISIRICVSLTLLFLFTLLYVSQGWLPGGCHLNIKFL